MKSSLVKKFVLDYLSLSDVKVEEDKNHIYTAHFTEVLANKLGKKRRFTFNREISDDYGVEYISLNNDLTKFILRDSLNKGQLVKATLEIPVKVEEKLKLDKNIFIKKEYKGHELAICFLFKISSTNNISDNNPEFLKFVVVDYKDGYVFPEEISEEFHNFQFSEAKFNFTPDNVPKAHSVAYETLEKYLRTKYLEYENTNRALCEERVKELQKRHEEFKHECRLDEKKKEDRLDYLRTRIVHARTYQAEENYGDQKEKVEQQLKTLKKENIQKANLHFQQTKARIEDEKSQFDFDITVHLVSAIVFQYGVSKLQLQSTITNEVVSVTYNILTNSIQEYPCPICEINAKQFHISINGHFCCPKCSSYEEREKGYLCKKDNVEKCMISGHFVRKNLENQCVSCKRYFDKKYVKKDIVGKRTCQLCVKKTYFGEDINKDDAIFSKKYDAFFKPSDVKKCDYSNEFYPLNDLVETSGSKKLVGKEFIGMCKFTNLTFVKNEMKTEKMSNLVFKMKEISTKQIKYKALQEAINKNTVEFNENKYWAMVRIKGLIRSKYLLYDKMRKRLI